MKVQYAWVVTDASGYRYLSTMSNHRYEAIETFLKDDIIHKLWKHLDTEKEGFSNKPNWIDLKKMGYTCSQVSIRSV